MMFLKLQFYQKEAPTLMFSCEYCEMFKKTYFEEHLRPVASYFVKKNKYSWRLNNSSIKILNQLTSVFSISQNDILTKKNSKKMHANLNKY